MTKLTSNEINDIAKLATAAAQLLEATGIAPNGPGTSSAEQLSAKLCEVALQMATTEVTIDLTTEQQAAFARHWRANNRGVEIVPLNAQPHYKKDDGPLTDEQMAAIRATSPASQIPDESFTHLFDEPGWENQGPVSYLAALLDNCEYGAINPEHVEIANESGLVIVYGASDDLMEFRGAIQDEIGAWEGTVALLDENGLVTEGSEGSAIHAINAHWCDDPTGEGFTWAYRTDIPHRTFRMIDGDEKYCRGIVFALADLKPAEQKLNVMFNGQPIGEYDADEVHQVGDLDSALDHLDLDAAEANASKVAERGPEFEAKPGDDDCGGACKI